MTSYDVKRLARIYALVAQLESMKVANIARESNGFSPEWGEDAFVEIQDEIERLAHCPDQEL